MNYFVYNGEKIYVDVSSSSLIFKVYEDNSLKELSKEKQEEIIKYLNKDRGYIYYSERLTSIIRENPSLNANSDYYTELLSFIERVIPEGYRDNFYNNLKTLKVELNLDAEPVKEKNSRDTDGNYNSMTNMVSMFPSHIESMVKSVSKSQTRDSNFWRYFNATLLHELLHMASSKYIPEQKKVLCGFDEYSEGISTMGNRGITEAMTEIIARQGIHLPDAYNISCGYFIQEGLVAQLSYIIGMDVMFKSYFGNLGTAKMEEALNELDDDRIKSKELFSSLECHFCLDKDVEQTFLTAIQCDLIDYFSRKILNDIERGVKDADIRKTLSEYKVNLITEEHLKAVGIDPSKRPYLEVSLNAFSSLEDKVELALKEREKVM